MMNGLTNRPVQAKVPPSPPPVREVTKQPLPVTGAHDAYEPRATGSSLKRAAGHYLPSPALRGLTRVSQKMKWLTGDVTFLRARAERLGIDVDLPSNPPADAVTRAAQEIALAERVRGKRLVFERFEEVYRLGAPSGYVGCVHAGIGPKGKNIDGTESVIPIELQTGKKIKWTGHEIVMPRLHEPLEQANPRAFYAPLYALRGDFDAYFESHVRPPVYGESVATSWLAWTPTDAVALVGWQDDVVHLFYYHAGQRNVERERQPGEVNNGVPVGQFHLPISHARAVQLSDTLGGVVRRLATDKFEIRFTR